MSHYIAILGAIKEEIAGIKKEMEIKETLHLKNASAYVGQWKGYSVVLVRTGMGQTRARQALVEVAERLRLVLVLSIGYAGALDPDMKVGDVFLADKVRYLEGNLEDFNEGSIKELPLVSALVNQAMFLACPRGVSVYRGNLLTVDRVVADPENKKKFGQQFAADAVEMETYALVEETESRALPFLSIRAISDEAGHELLDCSHLIQEDGKVSKVKAGWHVLSNPGDLKSLLALKECSKKATSSLTHFISQYLENYK